MNSQELLVELNFKKTGLTYMKQPDSDKGPECSVKWEGGGAVVSIKHEKYQITQTRACGGWFHGGGREGKGWIVLRLNLKLDLIWKRKEDVE